MSFFSHAFYVGLCRPMSLLPCFLCRPMSSSSMLSMQAYVFLLPCFLCRPMSFFSHAFYVGLCLLLPCFLCRPMSFFSHAFYVGLCHLLPYFLCRPYVFLLPCFLCRPMSSSPMLSRFLYFPFTGSSQCAFILAILLVYSASWLSASWLYPYAVR